MNITLRRALAASAASALLSAHAAHAAPELKARDGVWAQVYSDIAPDPDVRFGVLANGVRYAIQRNATPAHQASIRLRIGSGSLEERDDQQGLAHFLEHMAFKGSTHVPEGEMVRILQRHGLAFGPDTNASTGWDETVFMLDLPQNDADTISTGLMLMRETASELSITQHAMDPERGVVLSEERLRDTPSYEASKARLDFYLRGQLAADRWPIGKVAILQTAPASLIRQYYAANYRPDRATLVVVGDIDPAVMETQVKARFGDWRPVGPSVRDPDLGRPAPRGTQAQVVVKPGAGLQLQVVWLNPHDDAADTVAKRRRDTVEQLGFAVLNRRLERLARAAAPPFLSAGTARQDLFKSARLTVLQVNAQPGRWAPALAAAEATRRQAMQYGVRQDEVDREVTEYRTLLQAQVAGQATRATPQLASEIAQAVDEDEVVTNPAQDLALFEADVRGLTAARVSDALRRAFTGQGPLVSMTTSDPVPGGETALRAAFTGDEAAPVAPPQTQATRAWPYASFGPAGRVVERREVGDLGTTFVRFANGVRLTVRPSTLRRDQVLVSVRVGGGLLDLPRDRPSPTWAASALAEGGTRELTLEEIERILADKVAAVSFGVGEDAFDLGGATTTADLDVQMQLLAAYLDRPGFRSEALERRRAELLAALPQLEATPQGVEAEHRSEMEHSGDPRWRFPTRAEAVAVTAADWRGMIEPALKSGPIEVIVTGDTTVDQAVASVASTFAALPARPDVLKPDPAALRVRFPGPDAAPVRFTDTGRADQAVALEAWPIPDTLSDPQRVRRIRLAEQVLELRLIDRVRIAEGSTYSPSTGLDSSDVFPGYGFVQASVETPPAKIAAFYKALSDITAAMAAQGVTADELERARKPRVETITKAMQTNEFWRSGLAGAQTDPRRLDLIRQAISGLQAVSAADVQAAARTYLTDSRAWRMTVQAAPGVPASVGAPSSSK